MGTYELTFGLVRWHKTILAEEYRYWSFYKVLSFFQDSEAKILEGRTSCGSWPFIEATYNLEGDGSLALTCYETNQEVISSKEVTNIPNLQAIVKDISSATAVQQQPIAYGKNCVKQALHFKQQVHLLMFLKKWS